MSWKQRRGTATRGLLIVSLLLALVAVVVGCLYVLVANGMLQPVSLVRVPISNAAKNAGAWIDTATYPFDGDFTLVYDIDHDGNGDEYLFFKGFCLQSVGTTRDQNTADPAWSKEVTVRPSHLSRACSKAVRQLTGYPRSYSTRENWISAGKTTSGGADIWVMMYYTGGDQRSFFVIRDFNGDGAVDSCIYFRNLEPFYSELDVDCDGMLDTRTECESQAQTKLDGQFTYHPPEF